MSNKVLLIGANGFVGRALQAELKQQGISFNAIGRNSKVQPAAGAQISDDKLQDAAYFESLLDDVGVVIHVASASTPGGSAGKPLHELESNLRPTLALLEALQSAPRVRLIYVSSGGTLIHRPPSQSDEYQAVYSRSYHGAGKVAAEQFVQAWSEQFSGQATIVRPSNLYGPGQFERSGFGIVPAAMGRLIRKQELHIWGDGSTCRDYLYIGDFIRLLLKILKAPSTQGCRIFNACSGQSTSLSELLDLTEQVSGKHLHRIYVPSRAVDAPSVQLQSHRAEITYGWTAQIPLAAGLNLTWQWFISTHQ